ncbi:MAG: PrgI family protein, partial [Candidatus Dormibacteria bacterium]
MRIPADVGRPDRLLAGLTARQLAILAVAGVALWAAYLATRHLVPVAGFAAVAVPVGAVATLLAVGRVEGQPADRLV